MSDRYFVDTNILMYAHDTGAGGKHARAKALVEDLWQNTPGVVSTPVLQGLAAKFHQKAKTSPDAKATRDSVSDHLAWQDVLNGGDSSLDSLDWEVQYQISFWDAPVIQAVQASGAEILYSENLSNRQTYRTVRMINPLRARA